MPIQKREEVEVSGTLAVEITEALTAWGASNFRDFSWRSTDNLFHALIAEVMLQRTRAEQVEPVYNLFTELYTTPRSAAKDDSDSIREVLKPLGLKWRAEQVLKLVSELDRRGEVPVSYDELVTLPGVGQYAASSLLSLHLNTRKPLIDANTVKLWSRVFGFRSDSETRRKKWFIDLTDELTPPESFREFNYAVLDLTGILCKTKPLCNECPLNQICTFFEGIKDERE